MLTSKDVVRARKRALRAQFVLILVQSSKNKGLLCSSLAKRIFFSSKSLKDKTVIVIKKFDKWQLKSFPKHKVNSKYNL